MTAPDRLLTAPLLYTKATEAWTLFHAASLQRLQLFIQGNAMRWLWEAVAVTILDAPAALVLGVVGATLVFLGKPKIAARQRVLTRIGRSLSPPALDG